GGRTRSFRVEQHLYKRGCVPESLFSFQNSFTDAFSRILRRSQAVITTCLTLLLSWCVISLPGNAARCDYEPSSASSDGLVSGRNGPKSIVIGFLGGFVAHDEPHHPEVRMIQTLRAEYPGDSYFGLFENKKMDEAYKIVLKRLDVNQDGVLSD